MSLNPFSGWIENCKAHKKDFVECYVMFLWWIESFLRAWWQMEKRKWEEIVCLN